MKQKECPERYCDSAERVITFGSDECKKLLDLDEDDCVSCEYTKKKTVKSDSVQVDFVNVEMQNGVKKYCPSCRSKQAMIDVLSDSAKWLQSELDAAHEYLNSLHVPTNGIDADGNFGTGKRETLSLVQRLSFLKLRNKKCRLNTKV